MSIVQQKQVKEENFIPLDYKEPESGGGTYLKPKAGETHRLRIMGSFEYPVTAVMGWESWAEDAEGNQHPERREYNHDGYDELTEIDRDGKPKHFWLFQIYHIDSKEPQLWSIPQRTIQRQIRQFVENPNWGNPRNYNLAVTREGEGLQTKYSVVAEPPIEPPSDLMVEAMKEAKIDCREIFRGENPFGALTDGEHDDLPF